MRGQDSSDSCTHLIFDHLSGGVIAVDRSATLTYLNSTAARTLGRQPDTALDIPSVPDGEIPVSTPLRPLRA